MKSLVYRVNQTVDFQVSSEHTSHEMIGECVVEVGKQINSKDPSDNAKSLLLIPLYGASCARDFSYSCWNVLK